MVESKQIFYSYNISTVTVSRVIFIQHCLLVIFDLSICCNNVKQNSLIVFAKSANVVKRESKVKCSPTSSALP